MRNVQMLKKATLYFVFPIVCTAFFNTAWAKHDDFRSTSEKVKEGIDKAAEGLKKGVDKTKEGVASVQQKFDSYSWKGIIQDEAVSGPARVSHVRLNDQKMLTVRPGERINGKLKCILDADQCKSLDYYRLVLGFVGPVGGKDQTREEKARHAQDAVGVSLGLTAGKTHENFILIAPQEEGYYQLRFRAVDAYLEDDALKAWIDERGEEPTAETTVALIRVERE